jgi:hypothetical protein
MLNKKVMKIISSHSGFLEKNTKAQISDAVTWMVATIVIIVLLGITLYVTSSLGVIKDVSFSKTISLEDNIADKSLYGYLLTTEGDSNIYEELSEKKNLSVSNGNLAVNIFKEFYSEGPGGIWFGYMDDSNPYFGTKSTLDVVDVAGAALPNFYSKKIFLKNNKSVELLIREGR